VATLEPSTTDALRDVLADVAEGAAEVTWRKRIGIERVPTWRFVRFNCKAALRSAATWR
jgi:hypothetical protein